MAILIVHRDTPLSDTERVGLPPGVIVAQGIGDTVARAELNMTTDSLLQFAFKLGQAAPGGTLEVRGIAAPAPSTRPALPGAANGGTASAPAPTAAGSPTSAVESDDEVDPWQLAAAGNFTAAADRMVGVVLDSQGRDRLRELFDSTDPEKVAFACQAAGLTGWKSFSPNLRRVLTHGDVRVRREAATSLGFLAGPSLLPALEKLREDSSPEVREAAEQAIASIEAR